jgi:antitoxin (DNA-binding transcriptional repressor) of toxin-antitoxin stability system
MQVVSVTDFTTRPDEIWQMLPVEHELLVTRKGKTIARLLPLTDDEIEAEYEATKAAYLEEDRQELYRLLDEGMDDVRNGNMLSEDEFWDNINQVMASHGLAPAHQHV